MEGVPVAEKDCTCIRYIRGLSQRIQSIGQAPWTRFPKPTSRLVHLPQTPVLQSDPVVDLGLKAVVSSGWSEAVNVDVIPKVEIGNSLIPLPLDPDPDHVSGSLLGSGPEQSIPRCSENRNTEEILTSLRTHGILRCDPDPQVLPQHVHRYACTVPPGFEPLSSRSTRYNLNFPHPRPVYSSTCAVHPGLIQLPSTFTGIAHSDAISKPKFDPGFDPSLTLLKPRPVHVSSSPVAPGFEQELSSGFDTTDSDSISEPELICDTIRLARRAVLTSGAEVQRGLDHNIFTRFNKVLNNSESSDSDGKCCFIRAEGQSHLVQLPCLQTSGSDVAPHVDLDITFGSSDSSDCDNLSKAEVGRDLPPAVLASGNEVPSDVEQCSASRGHSASNSDSTDSDYLSVPEKRSSKCEVKCSGTGTASSWTGARVDAFVAEELTTKVIGGKDSEAALQAPNSEAVGTSRFKLNPNAKEFVPRALNCGNFYAKCAPESDRFQKVQLFGVDMTLSSAEAKAYAPLSARARSPVELGTALRMNHERKNWLRWSQAKEFIPRSNAEVVWGSRHGKASTDKSGAVQDLKLPFWNKSATPARQWKKNKRQDGHRPYYPAHPVRNVLKADNDMVRG